MRVLLTGASGFLGQATLYALRRRGIEVVALGRTRPRDLAGADFVAVDLLATPDVAQFTRAAGATHLVHLAWVTQHGEYADSLLNLRWVDATTRLVEAFCAAGGRHVVVAGSCAEYDWQGQGYCREDATPLCPATLYGVAKDATRRLVMGLCAHYGARCAWARVFFPFGAGEARERLLPQLVGALQGRIRPFGVNAQAQRDFLHADDVAGGLLALLQSDAAGSYNICSAQPLAIGDLVRLLAQLLDADPRPVLDLPSLRPAGPPMLAGENLKLTGLGWRPECTLVRGLQRMLSDMAARSHEPRRADPKGLPPQPAGRSYTSDHRGAVDGD